MLAALVSEDARPPCRSWHTGSCRVDEIGDEESATSVLVCRMSLLSAGAVPAWREASACRARGHGLGIA